MTDHHINTIPCGTDRYGNAIEWRDTHIKLNNFIKRDHFHIVAKHFIRWKVSSLLLLLLPHTVASISIQHTHNKWTNIPKMSHTYIFTVSFCHQWNLLTFVIQLRIANLTAKYMVNESARVECARVFVCGKYICLMAMQWLVVCGNKKNENGFASFICDSKRTNKFLLCTRVRDVGVVGVCINSIRYVYLFW